jgi:hypothetical protein
VLGGVGAPAGVHCCAAAAPLDSLRRAGAAFVSVDATLLTPRDDDQVGELLESGVHLLLGLVPALGADLPREVSTTTAPARELWRRLSYPAERLAERVTVTPTCGLAGASPDRARAVLTRAREAGRALAEAPEEM